MQLNCLHMYVRRVYLPANHYFYCSIRLIYLLTRYNDDHLIIHIHFPITISIMVCVRSTIVINYIYRNWFYFRYWLNRPIDTWLYRKTVAYRCRWQFITCAHLSCVGNRYEFDSIGTRKYDRFAHITSFIAIIMNSLIVPILNYLFRQKNFSITLSILVMITRKCDVFN
jgi:hypothetical protein